MSERAAPSRATTSGPLPGPWVGEVRRLVAGHEIEAVYLLDKTSDPIAEHHTLGGRRVSALDPTQKGLPVLPFAVMAEMTAQTAALVVSPGLVLVRLAQLRAHKWVQYEDEPIVLELRGRREPAGERALERVWVGLYNRGPGGRTQAPRPVFEAVAIFAGSAAPPPQAAPWSLAEPRTSRFTALSLYGEQWLFHGPAFQALVQVGNFSRDGIDGALRVLPWEPLLPPGRPAKLHTDLIVLDSFTHLLGCWGLDYLADNGDVIFPLRMRELALFGDRPPVGSDVACRITVQEIQRHRVRVSAEIVRPDGSVWMRLLDWEDWRFHWPSRYRDVFRQPQEIFLGEELPLASSADQPAGDFKAVWLAPPADMGRPVWRDVLESTQLGPAERAAHLAQGGADLGRSRRLWGFIAAKEAARRIGRSLDPESTYPADLAIVADESGRPILTRLDDASDRSLPSIAIADAEGVAVAIAARDPDARLGIAIAPIADQRGTATNVSSHQAKNRSCALDRRRAARVGRAVPVRQTGRGPIGRSDGRTGPAFRSSRRRRRAQRRSPHASRYVARRAALGRLKPPRRACVGLGTGKRNRFMTALRNRARILEDVSALLAEHMGITPSTTIDENTLFFADLGLASIDAVVLSEALAHHYQRPLPFNELMAELGRRTDRDLTIGELVTFLHSHLDD